jgi:hypothetical protein
MEYFMQKYTCIYMFQWIISTLYASGMYSTLGEKVACTAISVFVLGYSRVCLCQHIQSVGPC